MTAYRKSIIFPVLVLMLTALTLKAADTVQISREPLVLPTYQLGPADRNPIFYTGRQYQGAKGPIYPYPLLDTLSDNRVDRAWQVIRLENQYIRMTVLPEIGGRIFEGVDKTNNYDFFYRQHVIKPALIGMLGAWISGGVEWNIPHHHRATSFMPVDSTVTENPDGSRTVWVGETELRHRMRWVISLTVYPGRSYIECTVRLINRTPLAHSGLFFANPAVHVNEDYQVLFPPDVEWATFHAKNQFAAWPFSRDSYNNTDYSRGVDLSWWKNHPNPTSFFVYQSQMDFLAGYDHGRKAGLVHVADHNTMPGKKFWEWGNGPQGRLWDKILTEKDGPYIELMVGGFSDNQPDYSWIQPGEVKTVRGYWYPVRDIGGVKNATRDAAVNLEVSGGVARVGIQVTSEQKGSKAILRSSGRVVWERTADLAPGSPLVEDVRLPNGAREDTLEAALVSSSGAELVNYRVEPKRGTARPEPYRPPAEPKDIKTNEELYLAGLRLEQFYSADREPYPYYEEALRRDPGDYRVNAALGLLYLKRGMYKEAETRLQAAVARATQNHTRPRDGEALYYLGIVLKAEGRLAEAEDALQRAAWSLAWSSPAHLELAELRSSKGRFADALDFVEKSLAADSGNRRAHNLRISLLRRSGRMEEARSHAERLARLDPLDFRTANELCLTSSADGSADERVGCTPPAMRDDNNSYLELAVDYGNAGLWKEARAVLVRRQAISTSPAGPLISYYRGYCEEQTGDQNAAREAYRLAAGAPPDYCFPYQFEMVGVLRRAMEVNPKDARAPYYLGNLLFDHQPELAIREWEKSRSLDEGIAAVHRNLGFAYGQNAHDLTQAVASLERAVSIDGSDPRYLLELDEAYEAAGTAPEKRLALVQQHHGTVLKRDYTMERAVALLTREGRYDEAIGLLKDHHYHVWEGGAGIHGLWVAAHVQRGRQRLAAGSARDALADFEAAQSYPDNLEVARPEGPSSAQLLFLTGLAYEALKDAARAKASFEAAAAGRVGSADDRQARGLALKKLGRESEASAVFEGMIREGAPSSRGGRSRARSYVERSAADRNREAESHYAAGLGHMGKGDRAAASSEFKAALAAQPAHIAAAAALR